MRSALWRPEGGAPAGTVTVGACPAVPAGDRSAVGMVPMVVTCPAALVVVVVASGPLPVLYETLAAPDEWDGEELQAARPSGAGGGQGHQGERPAPRGGEEHGPRR